MKKIIILFLLFGLIYCFSFPKPIYYCRNKKIKITELKTIKINNLTFVLSKFDDLEDKSPLILILGIRTVF